MKDVDSKLVGIYKMFTMQLYWFYVMVEMAAICCKLYQFIHRKTVLLKELEPLFTRLSGDQLLKRFLKSRSQNEAINSERRKPL